jgi:hypothetical protein
MYDTKSVEQLPSEKKLEGTENTPTTPLDPPDWLKEHMPSDADHSHYHALRPE